MAEPNTDFDAIADELYGLQPDEFAAARDAAIKQARAARHADIARELGKLRRPTRSAWLINLLWRNERDLLESMLELGDALREAQAQASAADLQRLMAQRRQVELGLIRRARALASADGADVSDAMEREAQETLSAALARPEVADEIRTGRLVRPASYVGFGTAPIGLSRPASPARTENAAPTGNADRPAPPPAADLATYRAARARDRGDRTPAEPAEPAEPATRDRGDRTAADRDQAAPAEPAARDTAAPHAARQRDRAHATRQEAEKAELAEQAEEAERERDAAAEAERAAREEARAAAEAKVEGARQEAGVAADALARAAAAADAAATDFARLRHEVDAARAQLQRLQVAASRAEEHAFDTRRARADAERTHDTAQLALHRAERALDSLPPP